MLLWDDCKQRPLLGDDSTQQWRKCHDMWHHTTIEEVMQAGVFCRSAPRLLFALRGSPRLYKWIREWVCAEQWKCYNYLCGTRSLLYWKRNYYSHLSLHRIKFTLRRFNGSHGDLERLLRTSSTFYVGNLSFSTREEQIYELFSKCGDLKK
jgi:hypothetical protein